MALKLITAAVRAMAKGGVAGAAAGTAGKAASGMLSDNDQQKIQQVADQSQEIQQRQEERAKNTPPPITTETPKAVAGFAAMVQKEVAIAQQVENEEQKNRIYSGLERESTVGALLKGLRRSAFLLQRDAQEAIDAAQKRRLEYARQQDEERAEGLGDIFGKGYARVAEFTGKVKDGILAALTPFMTPALLFGGAYLANQINDLLPERFRANSIEDVLVAVDTAAEKISQIAGVAGITSVANRLGKATKSSLAALGIVKPPISAPVSAAAQAAVGKVKPGAAKYQKFLSKIQGAQVWFAKLQNSTNGIIAKASQWMARLPAKLSSILQKGMKKVLKWFLIFEILTALYNATQALVLGTITEAEWHTKNKEQIVKLLRIFGGPFVVMAIFAGLSAFVSTFIGGPLGSILGALSGGVAGLVVGIILGDTVFDILKLPMLVEGFYDMIVFGKWDKLKSFIPTLLKSVTVELPKMLLKYATDAAKAVGSTIVNLATGADRIATEEEISAEYGDDISTAELLRSAGEGMGTDENAILYAFKDIDTPEKYLELKKQFEENVLPDINEGRTQRGQFYSMEQYLRGELSEGEYNKLRSQVTQQMVRNQSNEKTDLNKFFRDVGYQELQLIPGIDDVTEEQLDQYNRGELVDVVVDGKKTLLTLEELREADIDRKFKQIARDQARMRKRQYEQRQMASEEAPARGGANEQQSPQGREQYLRDMAARMGIDATGNITGKFVGGVPVEINGQVVPNSVYTNEEREKVRAAEEARRMMGGDRQPTQRPSEPAPNITPVADKMAGNLAVVNQTINQQQRESTPAFGSGPRVQPSSARPTHDTTDSFIEPGFVT